MVGEDHSEQAIRIAEAEVAEWLEEVRVAKARVEMEEQKLRQAMRNLDTAKEFLELLHQRYGTRVRSEASRYLGPGSGVKLRDAALAVIERAGRATPREIIAELQARGFEFGKHPLRQLHAALLNNDKATKGGGGTWHWKGAGQVEMPLASVESHE